MKKIIFVTILISSLCFEVTHASVLSFYSTNSNVNVGERISISLSLNTEGESINSIETNIDFPKELLVFKGYDTKTSMIPFWVSVPKEQSPGSVYLSGVIPGGIDRMYDSENPNNKTIKMITLFFEAKATGVAIFEIKNAKILKNDGLGTADTIETLSKIINIRQSSNEGIAKDTRSPEPFTVSIIESSFFGKTPKLAVFEAEDINGGINKYQAKTSYGDFVDVTSPYPLPYKLFNYTLYIRAYDFADNFTEQAVSVNGSKPYGVSVLAITGVFFVLLYTYKFRKKR